MKQLYLLLALFGTLLCTSQNKITLEKKLFFEHNKFILTQEAQITLDSIAAISEKFSAFNITIVGYTDASGAVAYNQKLSYDRASSAFDYLLTKKINPAFMVYQGSGIDTKSNNEEIQRNTTVTFSASLEYSYYKTNTITGKLGTEITLNIKNESNANITLEEYFSTESMLGNEKYALDLNDNVLQTAGMIDIDLNNINPNDIEDGVIQVAIPTLANDNYDEEMTVWIEEFDKNGKKRWRNSILKPTWNNNSKRYEFKLNVSSFRGNRISINLDKNIYRNDLITSGKDKKVIIVATEKDEFFYDVYLSNQGENKNELKFSAKMDKTGFAFVIPKKVNSKTLTFHGKNSTGDYSFSLSSCKVLKYKNKYPLYKYIYKDYNAKKQNRNPEKKKGFWQWIKRQFQ